MAKLLIIEDDEALLGALVATLSASGHKVQAFNSGQAALDALDVIRANPLDIAIADVIMPGITGTQLLDAMRTYPEWKELPFLIISASVTPEVEEEIAALDGVIFLRKPFDSSTLEEAIEATLKLCDR